jgi:predicted nuclease with TOPRIM domain
MDKTKVDDFLIEMITPKVKEIEEKFTSNKPLSQDDINTLLLKSQYNHINHLDMKLNEVTADVSSLKGNFKVLEQKFELLEQNVNQRFETFEQRFETFEQKIDSTIQKALNRNMMLLIVSVGFFVTLSKVIDVFAK